MNDEKRKDDQDQDEREPREYVIDAAFNHSGVIEGDPYEVGTR